MAARQKRLLGVTKPTPASAACNDGFRPQTSTRIPGPTVSGRVRARTASTNLGRSPLSTSSSNPAPVKTSDSVSSSACGQRAVTGAPTAVARWSSARASGRSSWLMWA